MVQGPLDHAFTNLSRMGYQIIRFLMQFLIFYYFKNFIIFNRHIELAHKFCLKTPTWLDALCSIQIHVLKIGDESLLLLVLQEITRIKLKIPTNKSISQHISYNLMAKRPILTHVLVYWSSLTLQIEKIQIPIFLLSSLINFV